MYDTATLELISSKSLPNKNNQRCCQIHPDGKHVLLFISRKHVAYFTINDLELASEFKPHQPNNEDGDKEEYDQKVSRMAIDKTGCTLMVAVLDDRLQQSIVKVQ